MRGLVYGCLFGGLLWLIMFVSIWACFFANQ